MLPALLALEEPGLMELLPMLLVVSLVPSPTLGAPVPLGSSLASDLWKALLSGVSVPTGVLAGQDQLEVGQGIVEAVAVAMVDVGALWDSTVRSAPDSAVQADAITLEIKATQVEAAALKLLTGWRKDDRVHRVTSMRCDTAS